MAEAAAPSLEKYNDCLVRKAISACNIQTMVGIEIEKMVAQGSMLESRKETLDQELELVIAKNFDQGDA